MEERGTWIRTKDNVLTIVPNSEFITGPVTRWTVKDRNLRITLPLAVAHGSDPQHVRSILLGVARAHPNILRDPAPDVVFTSFGAGSLEFELRVWTGARGTVPKAFSSDLNSELRSVLTLDGIEMRFPQRELKLRSATPAALDLPGTIWRMLDAGKSISKRPRRQAKKLGHVGPPPVARSLWSDILEPQETGPPNFQCRTKTQPLPTPSK